MKWIIIPAVAALGLAVAAPTMAAPAAKTGVIQLAQRDRTNNRDRNREHKTAPQPTPRKSGPATQTQRRGPAMQTQKSNPPPATRTRQHAPTVQTQSPRTAPVTRTRRTTTRTRQPVETRRFDWNRYQQGRTPPRMRNVPRLNFHFWHRNFNAPKRFHREPYHRPNGWYYRRWLFGMVLPTIFWTHDYWIINYWEYGLPNPPYGYVWVRYGDDALLVNVRTGYVLQVVYDLFY